MFLDISCLVCNKDFSSKDDGHECLDGFRKKATPEEIKQFNEQYSNPIVWHDGWMENLNCQKKEPELPKE